VDDPLGQKYQFVCSIIMISIYNDCDGAFIQTHTVNLLQNPICKIKTSSFLKIQRQKIGAKKWLCKKEVG
jgi:hypothetical protein